MRGSWAQWVAIDTRMLAAVPKQVSDARAATLPTAALTALRSLEVAGPVLGKRVLVTGATGGVGRFAVRLAHASGSLVTALVRDAAASRVLLHHLGADRVVDCLVDSPDDTFDAVIDAVGGSTFGSSIEHLAPRGMLVNVATDPAQPTVSFRADRLDRAKGPASTH